MRCLAGVLALLAAICCSTGASAHAALVSVQPADGSVLAEAPQTVQLRFNEAVTPGAVRLIDAGGRVRDDALVSASGETIAVTLPAGLPRGSNVVSYRVVSQDGHPVAGSIVFSIGAATATARPADADAGIDGLIWLARVGLYIGLFAGISGVFFLHWVARERAASGLIVIALAVGMVSATASLGLQGLDVLGLPLLKLATWAPWKVALNTSLGPSLMIAVAAMAASLVAMRTLGTAIGRIVSALALLAVGLSLAASGHAATAEPQALTRPAMFLHGIGVAFWLGALAPLAALVCRPQGAPLAVLNRFSRIAVPVVAVLVLAGLGLATVQLGSFGALVGTNYGLILLTKLVLVAVLLELAALNRFRLVPALARDPQATRPLARSVLFECAAAMALLAVVAGWRLTPPPRTLIPDAPLAVHIHTEAAMFQVLISPGRVGDDGFVLQLMNGDGSPLQAKEATLTLNLPERDIEPFERSAELGPDGYWHVRKVTLPFAGHWHMRIDALVTDFEKVTLEDDFDVAAQ